MKGIEFPIATVIIIIVVVAVGVTLLYIFSGALRPASTSTTLDMATKATCEKITLFTDKMMWARIPVDDFDANDNGALNDRIIDAPYPTSSGDDNLESLCHNYYGCRINLITDAQWEEWRQCCIIRICGKTI